MGDLIFLAEHLKPPMVWQIQVSNGLIGQFQECILVAPPLLLPANTSVNIWNIWNTVDAYLWNAIDVNTVDAWNDMHREAEDIKAAILLHAISIMKGCATNSKVVLSAYFCLG